jgi:hypothetical protein
MARRSVAKVRESPPWTRYNYDAARILDAKLGPRRELTVRIELWREMSLGRGAIVSLRFGAIANYEEVQRFFSHPPFEELHYLRYLDESNPRRNVVEMEFDRTDDRIKIVAGNVSELACST